MFYLINAAEEYGLKDLKPRILENKNVHGIIVDVHPLWLLAWNIHLNDPSDTLLKSGYFEDYYYHYLHRGLMHPDLFDSYSFFGANQFQPIINTVSPIDIFWRPKFWNNTGLKSNILIKILLRPETEPIKIEYQGPLNIIQEHRSVPILSSNARSLFRPIKGGVSIGNSSNESGTLGGILTDQKTNKKYGLTCGHVVNSNNAIVDQPSQIDSNLSTRIGVSVFTKAPKFTGDCPCNKYDSDSVYNDMDISLIEIDDTINTKNEILNIGKVSGYTPANKLQRNLLVEFNGRSSGNKSLILGGIGVVNEITDAEGKAACFEHLIELKDPSLYHLAVSKPVLPGDSGAWVIAQGNSGNSWCGMIVGQDRQTGYAIMSEKILGCLYENGYELSI